MIHCLSGSLNHDFRPLPARAMFVTMNGSWAEWSPGYPEPRLTHTHGVVYDNPAIAAAELLSNISYLVYDTRTLLACSMACYSWCTTPMPHST